MRTRNVEETEVLALSTRDEGHFFDRKAIGVSGKNAQKIAVAFANADGGEFLVGVSDDKHEPNPARRWHGTERFEDFNGILQALRSVEPSLDLQYEILTPMSRPSQVLRVMVEKSAEVHRTSDETVYQRYGAQSLPITDARRITELAFAKGAVSFEDQLLKGVPVEQVVESSELASFLADYAPKTDPLEFCLNQNLLDYRTWEPRIAGILLFHSCPSVVNPRKCALKITRYETKADDPERDHLARQATIEGPLYRLIHAGVAEISKIMESVTIWTADGLKNAEYPPESIWEVLVNAVIHRDYATSDDIQVLIFDNRIEVLSPGRLPGYVTVENILEARYSRNPKIVRTLNRYKQPPNRDMGEGLDTAFQKMKEWGLRAPEIAEVRGYVRVTLPHTSLAKPSEAILGFLTKHETVTNRQARDLTGIKSENLVKIEFYKLKKAGLLEPVPGLKGSKSAWRLTNEGQAEAQRFR